MAGWIWFTFGADTTFLFSGMTTLAVIIYMVLFIPKPSKQ
jgi:hypothetical protein